MRLFNIFKKNKYEPFDEIFSTLDYTVKRDMLSTQVFKESWDFMKQNDLTTTTAENFLIISSEMMKRHSREVKLLQEYEATREEDIWTKKQ